MRITDPDPVFIVLAWLCVLAASVALMYARDVPVRIAGAILSSGSMLLALGWFGLINLWLFIGLAMFFGIRHRPLIGPSASRGIGQESTR